MCMAFQHGNRYSLENVLGVFLSRLHFSCNYSHLTVDTHELLLWEESSLTLDFGNMAKNVIVAGVSFM